MKPLRTLRHALAYDSLEEMIVSQVLNRRSTVTEEGLARPAHIGRTPNREALQRDSFGRGTALQ